MEAKNNKKSFVQRFVKWFFISFFILLVALIALPFLFKDQLKDLALKEANKMLLADVGIGDFDLTFISSFPKMKLVFDDVTVIGRNEFDGVHLVDINRFEASLNFWSVIGGDEIEITSIVLNQPNFDVRILQDGTANYDIVKSDDEQEKIVEAEVADEDDGAFVFKLAYYGVYDANIRYDDRESDMFASFQGLTHSGEVGLTSDIIDVSTQTLIEALTYKMDGVRLMNEVHTDLKMDLLMEFKEGSDKFTLKENELALNELRLSFDGFYEMFEGHSEMDLMLNAERTSFKELLSLIPTFYMTGYEGMVADGAFQMGAKVKGKMDDNVMPAFDFKLKIDNAKINYPDLPGSIDQIALDLSTTFPGGANLDAMRIDLTDAKAHFGSNSILLDFHTHNVLSDPSIKAKIEALVKLDELGNFIPLEEGETYQGLLTSDVALDGNMSAIDEERYTDFDAEGSLVLENFNYISDEFPEGVAIDKMAFLFSPEQLGLEELTGRFDETSFEAKGGISNYLAYMYSEDVLSGFFDLSMDYLDVNKYMPESDASSEDITEEQTEVEIVEEDVILIPSTIDFVVQTKIDKLKYEDLEIKNVNGKIVLRDEEAILDQLRMIAMDGEVVLSGKYNTQNHTKPFVDFSYDLRQIDIQQLVSNFVTIEQLAPVMKYAQGKLSTNFSVNTDVTPDFSPVLSTLSGNGGLFTRQVQLVGYKPIERLANVLSMDDLTNSTFRNVDIKFAFEDGKVNVAPFQVNVAGIRTEIEGSTSFEQEIDYELSMQLPRERIPGNVLKAVEDVIGKAQKIPGFKMKELPAHIPINVKMTNTVSDPKVETDLSEQLKALGGGVEDALRETFEETKERVKDTIRAVVEDKKEEALEELRKRKEKLLEDAQKQADRIVAEAKNIADRTRREGDSAAERIMEEAGSNPIRQRAAEATAKRTRDAAYDNAQKIEDEAKQRAQQIMRDAQTQADRLE